MKGYLKKILTTVIALSLALAPIQSGYANILMAPENAINMHSMQAEPSIPAIGKINQMDNECERCNCFHRCDMSGCMTVSCVSAAILPTFLLPTIQIFDKTPTIYSANQYINQAPDSLLRPPII